MTTLLVKKPGAALGLSHATAWFWGVMLVMSGLPVILWQELVGRSAEWLLPGRVGLLLALLVASLVWRDLKPLRPFLVILTALFLAEWLAGVAGRTAAWQQWFGSGGGFRVEMMGAQLLKLIVAMLMVATLFGVKRSREEFFLTTGNLRAPAQPLRWLGMDRPISWSRFGVICIVAASVSLLLFLFLAGRPSPGALLGALPMLLFVLLFAMMNAFSEEMSYRAALLSTSESVVGAPQAIMLSAVFFGIGHYYGVPYGVIGVLLSTFFGYLLGKGMVETRGLMWPWIIHMVADVWIFWFMAVGSVTPGG